MQCSRLQNSWIGKRPELLSMVFVVLYIGSLVAVKCPDTLVHSKLSIPIPLPPYNQVLASSIPYSLTIS